MKRILHFSCLRELTSGQRKQLQYEYDSAKELMINWDIVALHTGEVIDNRFEINIPKPFRGLFLKNLYGWLYLFKHRKKYDLILSRHMLFDPFTLIFSYLIVNRLSVHHAKESESLRAVNEGWKGFITSLIEIITGRIGLKNAIGGVCVTHEIASYQKSIVPIPMFIYPNGIDLNQIDILEDKRSSDQINIAFICTYFASWQGLDLLLESIKKNTNLLKIYNVKFHLIGEIFEKETLFIHNNHLAEFVITYGALPTSVYEEILKKCDVGLDSLALEREQLREGSALKVREYLSYGLPVYSNHPDTALPENYLYYHISKIDIQEMINFALSMKSFSRYDIRENSEKFISKNILLKKLYEELLEYYDETK